MNYQQKYLKYKSKYIDLKMKQTGGNQLVPNKLTKNLFKEIGTGSKVFSPVSIIFALGLVQLGAKGQTKAQLSDLMAKTYEINTLKKIYSEFNNSVIKLSNAVIINKSKKINPEYLNLVNNLALVKSANFNQPNKIVREINQYISDNTNSLIKNILSEQNISPSVIMIIINTIYFKSDWLNTFNPVQTKKIPFNDSQLIPMMNQINHYKYCKNDLAQVIELPYVNTDYVMGIILPLDRTHISKSDPISSLDFFNQNALMTKIDLYVPKFTHRENLDLGPILKKMGLVDLFGPKADLSGMADDLFISKIIHEAVVIVDETGTEAAAVTAIVLREMAARPDNIKPVIFKADHSFVYYIEHKPSRTILFVGLFDGEKN